MAALARVVVNGVLNSIPITRTIFRMLLFTRVLTDEFRV